MARKALNKTYDFRFTGKGVLGAEIEPNATKVDDNFVELFLQAGTHSVPLVPNGTSKAYVSFAGGRTITGIRARRLTALATGTITLAIHDEAGNTLLSAATIDATALTASFVAQTLTAVGANLIIAAGKSIVLILVSNNAGSTGGPVFVEITTAAI